MQMNLVTLCFVTSFCLCVCVCFLFSCRLVLIFDMFLVLCFVRIVVSFVCVLLMLRLLAVSCPVLSCPVLSCFFLSVLLACLPSCLLAYFLAFFLFPHTHETSAEERLMRAPFRDQGIRGPGVPCGCSSVGTL